MFMLKDIATLSQVYWYFISNYLYILKLCLALLYARISQPVYSSCQQKPEYRLGELECQVIYQENVACKLAELEVSFWCMIQTKLPLMSVVCLSLENHTIISIYHLDYNQYIPGLLFPYMIVFCGCCLLFFWSTIIQYALIALKLKNG